MSTKLSAKSFQVPVAFFGSFAFFPEAKRACKLPLRTCRPRHLFSPFLRITFRCVRQSKSCRAVRDVARACPVALRRRAEPKCLIHFLRHSGHVMQAPAPRAVLHHGPLRRLISLKTSLGLDVWTPGPPRWLLLPASPSRCATSKPAALKLWHAPLHKVRG